MYLAETGQLTDDMEHNDYDNDYNLFNQIKIYDHEENDSLDLYSRLMKVNNGTEYGTEEEMFYYQDYDPMVGYRIAISLGVLILLFIIFVLYKTHCHQQRNRRLTQNAAAATGTATATASSSSTHHGQAPNSQTSAIV
ncbi:hypothetical protein RDWZM_010582 [Blomia tropicalis]|uniref:Uncharacterized protein n=1 Tax=Blomia tropicalis TaxID=40697 RepID=A0A9Q0LZG6_BLOTA|nr:hypothetical protein RDWZM_010582 [Blomia tropicalis]